MKMTKEELKRRTKQFVLRIIQLVEELPNTKAEIQNPQSAMMCTFKTK
jgi:hypothetical protein